MTVHHIHIPIRPMSREEGGADVGNSVVVGLIRDSTSLEFH